MPGAADVIGLFGNPAATANGVGGGQGFHSYLQSHQQANQPGPADPGLNRRHEAETPPMTSERPVPQAEEPGHSRSAADTQRREGAGERDPTGDAEHAGKRKSTAGRTDERRPVDESPARKSTNTKNNDADQERGGGTRVASEEASTKRDAKKENTAKTAGESVESAGTVNVKSDAANAAAGIAAQIAEQAAAKSERRSGENKDRLFVKGEGRAAQGETKTGAANKALAEQMDSAELAKFAERMAAAKPGDSKSAIKDLADAAKDRGEKKELKDATKGVGLSKNGADPAVAGLRIELDQAKWQINGRAYGERGGSDTTETKLAGFMERYVKTAKGGASGKKGEGGEESRSDHRQQETRPGAARLNDLQSINGGELRNLNARDAFDMSRQKEEIARENRRLFNDLVERARVNVQSNGDSTASIRMNPAALGRMTLNLDVRQNAVHARIVVESDAARRMLTDEMENLRQELTRQGIHVESLSIRVREPANMSFMNGANTNDQSGNLPADQNAGGKNSGDSPNGERASEDQSRRFSGERAGEEYDLAAAAGGVGLASRREERAVNISI